MSSLHLFKVGTCAILMTGLAACATTQTATSDTSVQALSQTSGKSTLPKPTPEMIASIENASPLERAAFWLDQYHIHPTDLDISLAYIDALNEIKSYDKAAEIARFTSISYPDNVDILLLLGKAHIRNEKPADAIRAYGRAVDLAPDNPTPLAAMGVIFDKRGDHDNAQIAYKRALAIDPNRASTLANLGLSLSLVGKLDEAETALSKAASLPEATPAIRQNHALILGLLGRYEEAKAVAAIDAPKGIADQNTKFLQDLTGKSAQLQTISQSDNRSAPSQTVTKAAEVPATSPTQLVNTKALEDLAASRPQAPTQIAHSDTQSQTSPGLRLRKRQRDGISGGQD